VTQDAPDTEMYCLKCDYSLKGLSRHVCPECGQAFDPTDAKTWKGALGTTWPVVVYLIAWGFGLLTTVGMPILDTVDRAPAQLIGLAFLMGRLVVAVARKERNRAWIGYLLVCFLYQFVFFGIEALVGALRS